MYPCTCRDNLCLNFPMVWRENLFITNFSSFRILTLTSFPFRVVHVNRAFYTSNTFQQAMVTDIIGEGIFTMISRQYPSLPSPTLTTMPTLLALFDEDEIVQVSLAGKSGKKQTTSCKVNVRGVGRGIIQNSQDFLGTRTFLRGSCLRYFAVNLTPHFPVPSRNAAMKS